MPNILSVCLQGVDDHRVIAVAGAQTNPTNDLDFGSQASFGFSDN